jgi:hypothetical protein
MADDEDDDERENGADSALEDPIMPLVPPELGIDPILLALIHCAAFLDLASEQLVDPDSAGDVLENLELYVKRLEPTRLTEIQGQIEKLEEWADQSGWPEELVDFVADFLYSCGVGEEDEPEKADDGNGGV